MTTPLWPTDYNVSPDHCRDVLEGSYDVPYSPATPPVVLDLGANVGAFTLWASRRWPGCTIHAYEPHPGNFALLKRTVDTLEYPALVACHQVAVADIDGRAPLRMGGFNCGEWSLMCPTGKDPIDVQVIHATKLPHADVLKIDTEGAEVAILASLTYATRIREFSAVMIECHNGNWTAPLKVRMSENGFALVGENIHAEHRRELKWMRKEAKHE